MYPKAEKNKQYGFLIISIMLFLFCVLKVIRGANTTSTSEGGIWNYISLLYYVVVIFGIAKYKFFKVKVIFTAPLLFGIVSMLCALGARSVSLSSTRLYIFLMIPYFFLVFASFYFFTDSSAKAEKIILATYILCLIINSYTIIGFLLFGRSRAVASDIYYSLCLFPFALQIIKNKKWKTLIIFCQFSVTFLSNKRTGFIALCIGLILYFILDSYRDSKKDLLKVLNRIIVIGLTVFILYYFSTWIDNAFGFGIYDRLRRLNTDEGSGRGRMYVAVWQAIRNSNWIEVLFGHGMNTAGRVAGAGYAHNDFLEVFYDYGLFSFICIVVYYISIIRYAVVMIIRKSPYAAVFACSVVIGLALSLFSYFLIYYTFVTCLVAYWGYVIKLETKRLAEAELMDNCIKEESQ